MAKLDFSKVSIVVIGDVMLDSYWHGSTQRISPEAPVPVVGINKLEQRPGGAANVALNIKALGAKVSLVGLCGDDKEGKVLAQTLESHAIDVTLVKNPHVPTINKLRVLSQNQQLMRLDFEKDYYAVDKSELEDVFVKQLATADLVIISDYAKGTLSNVPTLIEYCKQHNLPVIIDPKGEDFSKYCGATMLTPNLKEFELIVGKCESEQELFRKGEAMRIEYQLDNLLVTRGAQGMTLFQKNNKPYHLAAQAKSVYDVTGAGDTVIGVFSTCIASGLSYQESLALANYAAGIVVEQVGAATVSPAELSGYSAKDNIGLSINALLTQLQHHRRSGQQYSLVRFDLAEPNSRWLSLLELQQQGCFIYLVLNANELAGNREKISSLVSQMSFISGFSFLEEQELNRVEAKAQMVLEDALV